MNYIIEKIKLIFPIKLKNFLKKILLIKPKVNFEKEKVIDKYISESKIDSFIETGTYMGDTLYRLKDKFTNLYSIELSEYYYKLALKRFKNVHNVNLIFGDSGQKLGELLNKNNIPFFFWLDGHYSQGITAKSETETPIMKELEAIFDNNKNNLKHVILVDDARLFNGARDYPTFDNLKKYIHSRDSEYSVFIDSDIIVCVKE